MDYECDENIAVLTKNVVNVTICTNTMKWLLLYRQTLGNTLLYAFNQSLYTFMALLNTKEILSQVQLFYEFRVDTLT